MTKEKTLKALARLKAMRKSKKMNDADTAWTFAQTMVSDGKTVVDYGYDEYRLVDQYYVELGD